MSTHQEASEALKRIRAAILNLRTEHGDAIFGTYEGDEIADAIDGLIVLRIADIRAALSPLPPCDGSDPMP